MEAFTYRIMLFTRKIHSLLYVFKYFCFKLYLIIYSVVKWLISINHIQHNCLHNACVCVCVCTVYIYYV